MNRDYSLKKNQDIEKLVRYKVSVGNKYYAIYYHQYEGKPQIAFSVSKKNGNAVVRNHQKRIVKEIIRQNLDKFNNMKALIVIKKTSIDLSFDEKKTQLENLINKIGKETK